MKRTEETARGAEEAAKRGTEAARRGQQAMNQSRKDMEPGHRNPGRLRPELSLQPGVSGRSSSGIGALVRVLIVLAVLAFILYALFIRVSHRCVLSQPSPVPRLTTSLPQASHTSHLT